MKKCFYFKEILNVGDFANYIIFNVCLVSLGGVVVSNNFFILFMFILSLYPKINFAAYLVGYGWIIIINV